MKVAFWVNNSGFADLDCSRINEGNPGIGGTEYSALLIAEGLSQRGLDALVLCNKRGKFSQNVRYHVCCDIIAACKFVKNNKFDYFVIDSRAIKEEILVSFPSVKFIAWANCFIDGWMNKVFPIYSNIIKFVNVGREQAKLCNSMPIAPKSTFIYNAVSIEHIHFTELTPFSERKHKVVYIGSLHKAKGFHYLAKAWPKVLKSIPDAELYVIGSGKLYSRNSKLGKWGIASEEYEQEFMPYLIENNKIHPSVHFMGILGKEKFDVLSMCKVGVPNPSGESETFGFTAVEMQLFGSLVTTMRCPGYVDTVCNQDNLYNSVEELPSFIIELLKRNVNNDDILSFVDRFSLDKVCNEWMKLFSEHNIPVTSRIKSISFRYIWNNVILLLKMNKHKIQAYVK